MTIAFVPGSFDPITLGHIDIIRRTSEKYEQTVVAVMMNSKKQHLFDIRTRLDLIYESLEQENIKVNNIVMFDGLLANLVEKYDSKEKSIIVKGLRTVTDFEYELQMAHLNKDLGLETSFMITSPEYSYVSSSMVKEVARLNGDFEKYVTPNVFKALKSKY